MSDAETPSDSMRAQLGAELRSMDEEGSEAEPDSSRPGGTFSLGLIALASWLGVGFGGVVLTTLNDWRLGNRPVWRSAALFCLVRADTLSREFGDKHLGREEIAGVLGMLAGLGYFTRG